MATLVGDRFVRMAGGWVDLVSGRVVDVRLGRAPADAEAQARRCAAVFDTLPLVGPRLVDFGPMGADGWFEASGWGDPGGDEATGAVFRLRRLPRAAIPALVSVAADPLLRGVRHVQFVAPKQSGARIALEEMARALRALGFVTMRADAALPASVRRRLVHRHLAVLVMNPSAKSSGTEWAARLAATSDRGHLLIERVETASGAEAAAVSVVSLAPCAHAELVAAYVPGAAPLPQAAIEDAAVASGGWPGRFARELAHRHAAGRQPAGARERAGGAAMSVSVGTAWPFSVSLPNGDVAAANALRLSRADRCHRRGRAEAGDRWLNAGIEAGRRRGQAHEVLRALEGWVPRLIAAGRWRRAAAMATRALGDAIDPALRATAARLAATAHLEAGQLSRAETCIDTALAIEQLTHGRPANASLAVRAACRVWQGRWREGRAELEVLAPEHLRTPAIAKWRELLAWAEDDERRQRWMPVEDGAAAEDVWTLAVLLFRAAASGMRAPLLATLAAHPGGGPWRAVISAQAWLDSGDDDAARRELARCPVRPVAARGLVDVVAASVRRGVSTATAEEMSWLDAVVSRERLRGVARWGQGRSSMQMLHDMSQLLEIVQGCEDEAAGLRQVCAWAQAASGATGCAIVSAPGGDVVAGDALEQCGVARGHLLTWLDRPAPVLDEGRAEAHARAPIRYGGATVGLVLGVAPPARARALFDAVQAAGVVSGAMLRARLDAITAAARTDTLSRDIIGTSPAIAAVRASAARAALAPYSVVIEGESGTGKELVARALHRLGPRRDRPFAALNCAALTDELVEAELFGHARGAFTHAVNARAGLFEEAHQGTLFLDEVGELSPRAQAKLLRVLQEGEIRRVGENESRPVDVRVLAATNRPLAALAAAGRFREDLMFRLSVIRIQVPPLRDRAGDVPSLALTFWRQAAGRVGTRAMLGPDAIALLAGMPWPGNVRELQNAMAALAVAAPATGRIGARLVRHVLTDMVGAAPGDADIVPMVEARRHMERRLVAAALAKHTGSRMAAAHALGLSRQGLAKAMRRLGLVEAGVA